MKSTILWTLVGLNALLLIGLLGKIMPENTAKAQVRRPAEYLMIPGKVIGGISEVVYIVDASNSRLSAMTYDDARQVLDTMRPIDLTQIFDAAAAQRGDGNRGNQ